MPRLKDQALCIRHLDWSETSQIVVLLTPRYGKLRGLAKGSKRLSPSAVARFSGGIELLTLGQVVATVRPTSELANVTEWDLQHDFLPLRQDLTRQRLALYAADLGHAMLADHDPHPETFHVTHLFLEELIGAKHHATQARCLLHFQWALLQDTGFRPQLDTDVHTGNTIGLHARYWFDPRAGGLTLQQAGNWAVRHETVELLQDVATGQNLDQADTATVGRANRLLCVYARSLLDRELSTMRFVLDHS